MRRDGEGALMQPPIDHVPVSSYAVVPCPGAIVISDAGKPC
jgi:hypothetical protein